MRRLALPAVLTVLVQLGFGVGLSAGETFTDPFAYCRAVGTIDAPDARYTGAKMPESVARGLRKAFGVSSDAPLEPFRDDSVWRCMDGKLYACSVGANLPCQEKADTSKTPSAAMTEFCKSNAEADAIPAYVTGRATVYEWRCAKGAPAVVRQLTKVDPQGYLADIWYALSPP